MAPLRQRRHLAAVERGSSSRRRCLPRWDTRAPARVQTTHAIIASLHPSLSLSVSLSLSADADARRVRPSRMPGFAGIGRARRALAGGHRPPDLQCRASGTDLQWRSCATDASRSEACSRAQRGGRARRALAGGHRPPDAALCAACSPRSGRTCSGAPAPRTRRSAPLAAARSAADAPAGRLQAATGRRTRRSAPLIPSEIAATTVPPR